jgi:hypothetical protein
LYTIPDSSSQIIIFTYFGCWSTSMWTFDSSGGKRRPAKCSPRRKAVKKVKGHFRRNDDQFVLKMTNNLDMSCTSLWNWRRKKTKNSGLSRESQSCKSAKMLTPLCLARYWSYNLFRRETVFTAKDSQPTEFILLR